MSRPFKSKNQLILVLSPLCSKLCSTIHCVVLYGYIYKLYLFINQYILRYFNVPEHSANCYVNTVMVWVPTGLSLPVTPCVSVIDGWGYLLTWVMKACLCASDQWLAVLLPLGQSRPPFCCMLTVD